MADTLEFAPGDYRYIPGPFQYSGGIAAQPGFEIRRIQFRTPVPLAQGFERIERLITASGRPLTSFGACELRSPAPFTDEGFRAFNESYVATLAKWGLFDGVTNPVARSNVCPEIDPPSAPSFHAFSFTVASADVAPTFVISGSGETREGTGTYAERGIRIGETSDDAMRDKADHVFGEMERRLALLGVDWSRTTATQVYTVYNIFPFLADGIVRRGAARAGITWHFNRPPVRGLDFEVDCRGVALERVV